MEEHSAKENVYPADSERIHVVEMDSLLKKQSAATDEELAWRW